MPRYTRRRRPESEEAQTANPALTSAGLIELGLRLRENDRRYALDAEQLRQRAEDQDRDFALREAEYSFKRDFKNSEASAIRELSSLNPADPNYTIQRAGLLAKYPMAASSQAFSEYLGSYDKAHEPVAAMVENLRSKTGRLDVPVQKDQNGRTYVDGVKVSAYLAIFDKIKNHVAEGTIPETRGIAYINKITDSLNKPTEEAATAMSDITADIIRTKSYNESKKAARGQVASYINAIQEQQKNMRSIYDAALARSATTPTESDKTIIKEYDDLNKQVLHLSKNLTNPEYMGDVLSDRVWDPNAMTYKPKEVTPPATTTPPTPASATPEPATASATPTTKSVVSQIDEPVVGNPSLEGM